MNQEARIKTLETKINELENRLLAYETVESIKDMIFEHEGTASTQSIVLTGDVQTITPPAQPSGTLTVIYKGKRYQLLYA